MKTEDTIKRKRFKLNIFELYEEYLKVYPEWYIIKKHIEGKDITIINKN